MGKIKTSIVKIVIHCQSYVLYLMYFLGLINCIIFFASFLSSLHILYLHDHIYKGEGKRL